MKIKVYYRNEFLGEFTEQNGEYVYNSSADEKLAKENYLLNLTEYAELLDSTNKTSKEMFRFFKRAVDQIKQREDLIKEAGIVEGDSDFVILAKYAKLDQFKQKFHFAV